MKRVLLLALLAGCDPFEFDLELDFRGGTSGDLGRATFGYAQGCEHGLLAPYCETDRYAVLRGGSAVIDVWAKSPLTDLDVRSGDRAILEIVDVSSFPDANLHVRVVGGAPGLAPLELYDGGELFDRVWVSVDDAARLALDANQLAVGGSVQSFSAHAFAADGRPLFGRGVIAFDPGAQPTFEPTAEDNETFVGTDHVVVETPATGPFTIDATLGPLVASTTIDIVDVSAVDHIAVVSSGVSEEKAGILFAPVSADNRVVRGAHCVTAVQAPFAIELEVHPAGPVPKLFAGDHVAVSSAEHGAAEVSCTIGSTVASTTLTF